MWKPIGKWVAALLLVFLTLSCARLPDTGPPEGDGFEELPGVRPVPAAWGELVAVTQKGGFQFQLWFYDDQGTVRMVGYDVRNRSLVPQVELIPRQ